VRFRDVAATDEADIKGHGMYQSVITRHAARQERGRYDHGERCSGNSNEHG
jgi:hypothetical protein